MIAFNKLNQQLKNDLKKLDNDHQIVIKTFKKDRSITIYLEDNEYIINQAGYEHETYHFSIEDLKEFNKQLKQSIKKEFPRSSQIWYQYKLKE